MVSVFVAQIYHTHQTRKPNIESGAGKNNKALNCMTELVVRAQSMLNNN